MASSPEEIANLVASGAFVNEGQVGHVYSGPAPGAEVLLRYSNGNGWRLGFGDEDAALKAAGYRLDGRLGYVPRSWYEVGAYYFGAYDDAINPPLLAAIQRLYGRYPDPWGGVRDFSGGDPAVPRNTQGWGGDWSHLVPTIGFYDDSRPEVLEQQIQQAAAHGLSYFAFYAYWDNERGTPQYDRALKAFLAARNSAAMQFAITPCISTAQSEHLSLPESQFAAAAAAFAAYTREPNYLTDQEGRPIVFMCDTRGIGDGSVAARNRFLALLIREITAASGKAPYLLQQTEGSAPEAPEQLLGDGYSCLNMGRYILDGSYREYVEQLRSYFARFDAFAPTLRCGMSGFDERPRTNLGRPASAMRYFKDDSLSQFPAAMAATRADLQGGPATPVDNYLTIYAWNEWHEGGHIEPNVRDGDYYLRVLRDTFGLIPRAADLPVATLPPAPVPAPAAAPVRRKRPVLSRLSLRPRRFAVGKRRGTTVRWHDSAAARTRLTVLRRVQAKPPARQRPKRKAKGHRRRWVAVGAFTHKDRRGANRLRFTGILAGKRLRPGRYRVKLVPRLGGVRGAAIQKAFRVVR